MISHARARVMSDMGARISYQLNIQMGIIRIYFRGFRAYEDMEVWTVGSI